MKRLLREGGLAYSVPSQLANVHVRVLFEADGCETIQFARISLEWVTEAPCA